MRNLRDMRQAARYVSTRAYLKQALPYIIGTWFFVDPTDGANGRSGQDPDAPLADVTTAYGKCTDARGDGICVFSRDDGTSASTTSYSTAVLDWAKHGITMIGISSGSPYAGRARIANNTSSLALAYLIDFQSANNRILNMHIANYGSGAGALGGTILSGNRNYFGNCHLVGGGHATPGIEILSSNLTLTGDENFFEDCIIGTDTYNKGDSAGGDLILNGNGARNYFKSCEFRNKRSAGTTAGAINILGSGAGITRTIIFDDCFFHSYRDGNVPAHATVIIGTAPNNGIIVFKNCLRMGYTDWGAVAMTTRCVNNLGQGHEAGGAMVAANPS